MRGEPEVLLAGLIVLLLCAGCAGVPSSTEVRVPVPTACVDAQLARPHTFSAAEFKAMDDYHLALALEHDRRQLEIYAGRLEAALAGCWIPNHSGGT